LKERGCTIWGIERDEHAAQAAVQVCDRVIVADLEGEHAFDDLGDDTFDVLLALDVLEHLRNPAAVLRRAATSLRPEGITIASIPNVTHGALRLSLLEGRFDYTEQGLLDRMHLRFFDRRGAERLMSEAGLTITQHLRVRRELHETEITVNTDGMPAEVLRRLARDADATTYQFVFVARRADGPVSSSPHVTLPERLLAENDSLLARLKEMETSITSLEVERGQFQATHSDAAARCLELQRERDEVREEIGRRIQEAHGIQRDLNACKASLVVKDAFISDLRQQLQAVPALVSERDELRAEDDRLLVERDRSNSELADVRQRVLAMPALLAERDELSAAYDRLFVHHDRMRAERDDLRAERDGLRAERDGLRAERDGLRAERDGLCAERDGLRAERDGLCAERDGLCAERDGLLAQQREWLTERNHLVASCSQLDEARQKLQRCRREAAQLHDDLQQSRVDAVAKDTEVSQLHHEMSQLHERVLAMKSIVAEHGELSARCNRLAAKREELSSRRNQLMAERDSLLKRQRQQEKTLREMRRYTNSAGFRLTQALIVRLRSVPFAYKATRAIARSIVKPKAVD
jgi:chromosome segregation ATPase